MRVNFVCVCVCGGPSTRREKRGTLYGIDGSKIKNRTDGNRATRKGGEGSRFGGKVILPDPLLLLNMGLG